MVQADGKIVVAGFTRRATTDYVVARYDTSGVLDTASFNLPLGYFISTNGATDDAATGVAIQSDGKIVISGWGNNGIDDDFLAARFDATGSLDGSFGGAPCPSPSGPAWTGQMDWSSNPTATSSSRVRSPTASGGTCSARHDSIRTVPWTGPSILPGRSAAPNAPGMVTTDFTPVHDNVRSVILQAADNKIVVGGWANWDGVAAAVDFALARYNPDGSLDLTFDGDGLVTTPVGGGNDWIDAIALQSDGKIIIAAGYSDNGADDDFAVARYNTDGSLDATCAVCCAPLYTTESAGTTTITASGKFELRFNQTTGGGIDEFFDLVEDPGKTVDFAGGLNFYLTLFDEWFFDGTTQFNTSSNNVGAKLDLLEATPTRVKVRQEASYQDLVSAATLAGVKGTGDYSIYPSGRYALRWNRKTTGVVAFADNELELAVHWVNSSNPKTWIAWSESGPPPGQPGGDDFVMRQIDEASARTDFLKIMYQDWISGTDYVNTADAVWRWDSAPGDQYKLVVWRDNVPESSLPAGADETWNFLTYFKPTSFVDNLDAQVTSRRDDYRGPDVLSFVDGGPWIDANENTGAGDDYNESEGAYVLTFDPLLGLGFDIDGGTTTRYLPFFKIRRWRSLQDPITVTLDGAALTNDVDYKADVKPISRGHWDATGAGSFTELAHGGLNGHVDEYLATGLNNFALNFASISTWARIRSFVA